MTSPISPSLSADPDQDCTLVRALTPGKPADKAHQRFRQLVTQIERQRELLKSWQAYPARYHQRLLGELAPLEAQLRAARQETALLIDTLLTQSEPRYRLARAHRLTLRERLMELLDGLADHEDPDETLQALRDKYREPLKEEEQRVEMELAQGFLNGVLNLEIGDDHGASTPEELMEYARRKMQEREDEERREALSRRHSRGRQGSRGSGESEAAQARREQAAREVSQSLRDVFRKLVSALHPDREPDAAQRQRKNELMQRVNRAYEANDLLTLLGLQLQIEQIDAAHLSSISSQRLTHYIQILSEQLAELEAEVERCREPFRAMLRFGGKRQLTVEDVDRQLSEHLAQMRRAVQELRKDLTVFRDPLRLRQWLQSAERDVDFGFFDPLEESPGLAEASRPRARRGRSRRRKNLSRRP